MVCSMERWQGKVAIVTGASAGIGMHISKKLLENGVDVVGFARRIEKMQEYAEEWSELPGKFYCCKVDMTVEEDIINGFQWTTENIGPVNILINNAGLLTNTSLYDGDTALWKKVLDTNVLGLCIATREAIKIMNENDIAGHIIDMNSVLGHQVMNFPNWNLYSASKFAVTAIAETLRMELEMANSNIKVTSISPGAVRTEFLEASKQDNVDEMVQHISFLNATDVADTIVFALSTPPNVLIKELIVQALGGAH